MFRLGLAATYRPGERAIEYALDNGVGYLFGFAIDTQLTRVVRGMNADRRERVTLATGGYNWVVGRTSLRRSLENALRRYRTDYIDVFHFLGVLRPKECPAAVFDEMNALKAEGKVRSTAVSTHDLRFAGEVSGLVDAVMVRYNAAHRGAEQLVFPNASRVIAYTATRWGRLLVRPRGWPAEEPVATAGQCYRFVLSSPAVDVVLTAPRNEDELRENIHEALRGPLDEDELAFMRRFGDCVERRAGWFM